MNTILDILGKAGGWHPGLYLKIDNPPYMELVIEAMDESGPCGLPSISVAHYGEQNGDAMRDPEMCFELGFAGGAHLNPFYWRNEIHRDSRRQAEVKRRGQASRVRGMQVRDRGHHHRRR
jgi:hypothetical protein